jgi:hypothetical protein
MRSSRPRQKSPLALLPQILRERERRFRPELDQLVAEVARVLCQRRGGQNGAGPGRARGDQDRAGNRDRLQPRFYDVRLR